MKQLSLLAGLLALPLCALPLHARAAQPDPHSFAEPHRVLSTHLHLDLAVDFDKRQLIGSVTLDLKRLDATAKTLVLDTRDLDIRKVEAGSGETLKPAPFKLRAVDAALGAALDISLPDNANRVRVHYASSPKASGLQWLTPAMTAGKKHPFMFSQAQAIHARSFIPLQDSPQVRVTYSAIVRTPKHLRAVMSADNNPEKSADGVYRFTMPQAIPSYLIAIAAGDLGFKAMSERTGVYAEPATLDAAAREFADTEKMVLVTEKLYGPYAWGRYDLLILPPSFPFGGMENPRLSFITPTVIAGDKSLVSLIAHELAHSWSGNLVTNSTWNDLWLNEGFTTYVENRIMEELYGREHAEMEQVLGMRALSEGLKRAQPEHRSLHVDLKGMDPDDAFSEIPYQKGALFLRWLEQKFGRAEFDKFVHGYFEHFKFKTLDHLAFRDYLKTALLDKKPGVVTQEHVDQWLYGEQTPADVGLPKSTRFAAVKEEARAFLGGERFAEKLKASAWTTQEWLYFLGLLEKPLAPNLILGLDRAWKLSQTGNAEIAHAWFLHAIASDYRPAWPALERYITTIGRRKLVVPLYEALMTTPDNRSFAKQAYEKARPAWHPLTVGSVGKIVETP